MAGRVLRLVCTAAVAAQAALAPVSAAAAPAPPPAQRSVAGLLKDLQQRYRQAERATEAYDATAERLTKQRAEAALLEAELTRARAALRDSRSAAGRLARRQYQGSTGLSPYVRLLLARDPQHALEEGHLIGQLAREQAETVGRLAGRERAADGLARRARAALDARTRLAARQRTARDDVRGRLSGVERLLSSLTPAQLAALAALEQRGIADAQREFLASGALGLTGAPQAPGASGPGVSVSAGAGGAPGVAAGPSAAAVASGGAGTLAGGGAPLAPGAPGVPGAAGGRAPSEAGARAVRWAVRQLGKPYQWGAQGPQAYDCSGLTSQAWGYAGTPIPRTSQQQWARLPRVALSDLRPGDLVVYFHEATHVALYLGGGLVVQAPRPGTRVKVSPVAANPVLGAVRPDPGGEPLRRYTPPVLPPDAPGGPDAGFYAAPAAPATSAR
ncbi:C40 family peptidase [Streptomyces tropicalis]|uniref:NlpC/P60 family protein n=1 Tax=Streptomyces tropicalis TaxID=3034234 RepID=A0ABT5ZZW1_9ACTN|nr:NlpC/P60 family protein [Streptomyces tropicalis]MDF3297911.1 NlpC/P60 family protein [Streptomyces tropicalis]